MTITQTDLHQRLRQHFGFHRFRPGQARAVQAALEGKDTLVLMPTGSGKSLCFQLPALELEGITVVVSPLIALMKDQVGQLRERGIAAYEVNSSLSAQQRRTAEEAIATGQTHFIYTTPEQLDVPEFRDLLKRQPLDLFVVDEAHCISQWGHDFRPDYFALGQVLDDLGRPPVLALTATSTEEILEDILLSLGIPDAEIIHTGFYRPNLHLAVRPTVGDSEKRLQLTALLTECAKAFIVYCATVKAVEELAVHLQQEGIEAEIYHGRLAAKRRALAQERFMQGVVPIMVATNAFGLGIDKPDIRHVIHYQMPATLESFYQEFGRAGRDGQPSSGTLLYDREDAKLQRFLGGGKFPNDTDLVNAYHALRRLTEEGEQPTLSQVEAIAPLKKARLKACLDLFVQRRIAARDGRKRYCLVQTELDRDQLARASQSCAEREELAKVRQQSMVEYAEKPTCRWQQLLAYFDSDELPSGKCGHCDCCGSGTAPA